jgi:hypothetical protein
MTATMTRKRAKAQDEDLEQKFLNGVDPPPKDAKMEKIGRALNAIRTRRLDDQRQEADLVGQAADRMEELEVEVYKSKDLTMTMSTKRKIKVTCNAEETEDEE